MDPQYLPGDELVSESSLGHGQFGLQCVSRLLGSIVTGDADQS